MRKRRRYSSFAMSEPMNPGLYGPKVFGKRPRARFASSLPIKPGLNLRPLLVTTGSMNTANMKARAKAMMKAIESGEDIWRACAVKTCAG